MPKTIGIIYGWAEGPWESSLLRAFVGQSGDELTKDLASADCLMAHSLGCFLIPKKTRASTLILVGAPIWPKRRYMNSVIKMLVLELKYHKRSHSLSWWLNKLAHNTWYILTKPSLSWKVLTRKNVVNIPKGSTVYLVRNELDTFLHPEAATELAKQKGYKLRQMPGLHDDIWTNPKPYLDLARGL